MSESKKLTNNAGAPVVDNQNVLTAGPRGPMMLQDAWFLEKLAHFDREVIPEAWVRDVRHGDHGRFGFAFFFTPRVDASGYLAGAGAPRPTGSETVNTVPLPRSLET